MNNGDFNDILNALAENPDTLRKLVSAVGDDGGGRRHFGGSGNSYNVPSEKSAVQETDRNRDVDNLVRLLLALKPFLDESKGEKIDGAVRILRIISLASGSGLIGREKERT